jgi:D-glycero-beta-D-manno-heptose-7-phosphate kinase
MKKEAGQMLDAIRSFKNLRPLVIGDVMVDAYLWGKVDRISPEAPVPIVSVNRRMSRLGGAANVIRNLLSLGSNPQICAAIGDDPRGQEFLRMMEEEGLSTEGIIICNGRITTTKFRVIGNNVQMLRVDEESDMPLNREEEARLWARISGLICEGQVDVIIFEDYDKGVITRNIIQKTTALASSKGIPLVVDPKFRNFHNYKGVDLFKPNLKELREGLKTDVDPRDAAQLKAALDQCHDLFGHKAVLLTLSQDGVIVSEGTQRLGRKSFHFPAHLREVADVSGAGDTVISVAALALRSGLGMDDVAWLANLAGGLVCEEIGVVPVNIDRLLKEAADLFQHRKA